MNPSLISEGVSKVNQAKCTLYMLAENILNEDGHSPRGAIIRLCADLLSRAEMDLASGTFGTANKQNTGEII